MPRPRRCRSVPRPGVYTVPGPIDSDAAARALVDDLLARPARDETIAVLLDELRHGVGIVSVDRTVDPDAVLVVAEFVAAIALDEPAVDAAILVSVRPGGHDHLDDVDRWVELDVLLDDAGLTLLEWYVVGDGVSCPRALLDETSRWSRAAGSGR